MTERDDDVVGAPAPLPRVGSVWQPKDDRDGPAKTVVGFTDTHAILEGAIRTKVRLPLTRRYTLVRP